MPQMNRARPSQGSPHTSPQGEAWQRKTVRELEVELETAAHFIRKMQETEEVLSNHVRDVVAEKNDAVQALTRLQGRVAGMENEIARLRANGQKSNSDSAEAMREAARMKTERAHFEEQVMARAQAERHEVLLQKSEIEGKLMAEMAKVEPLTNKNKALKSELNQLRQERREQDELITQLHTVVKELKGSREQVLGNLEQQQELSKHAVSRLEGALESAGVDHLRAENKAKAHRRAAASKMLTGVMSRRAFGGARLRLFNWRQNLQQERGSHAAGVTASLQERLATLISEHEQTLEELRASDSERHRLSVQLKETIAERQILVMEVENLKTVGEQLVSDLVATASEVFEELESSKARKAVQGGSRAGPTADRLAKSVGAGMATGMVPRGR